MADIEPLELDPFEWDLEPIEFDFDLPAWDFEPLEFNLDSIEWNFDPIAWPTWADLQSGINDL